MNVGQDAEGRDELAAELPDKVDEAIVELDDIIGDLRSINCPEVDVSDAIATLTGVVEMLRDDDE